MKLRVFHSDKGDCLLVRGAGGGRILSDGGMRESFVAHVAKNLTAEDPIDLVCVSHVDDDHIAGVLEMLNNAMAWKVFQHHQDEGDTDFNEPDVPKVPKIKRIWHNAFHDQVGENAGPISDMLSAMVPLLSNIDDGGLRAAALENQAIVTSNKQAIQVSQRLRSEQLNIPLNENDKLILVRDDNEPFKFGSLSVEIMAPFEQDVAKFRADWNKWLADNKETVKKLRQQAKEDARELENDVAALVEPALSAQTLGDRSLVTPPNLASIMLFVKDGNQTLLLTGDGHANDALKGLDHLGKLDGDGKIHVNILKVQHHGSEHNWTDEFAQRVTADNYIFCGNGFSGNPEKIVLESLFNARVAGAGPNKKFKFWFNSSSASESKQDRKKHMRDTEKLVGDMKDQSGRLQSFFLGTDDFFDMTP